jgi:hypothetical protein
MNKNHTENTQSNQFCRGYADCSAPLCPLDSGLEHAKWFPDEPICNSRIHGPGNGWIENQRKVARKTRCFDSCYTLEMLNRRFVIRKGIQGVDPDSKDLELDIKKWTDKHPAMTKQQISNKQALARQMREKTRLSKAI